MIIIPLSLFLRAKPQDMGLLPDGESMDEEKGEEDLRQRKADKFIVDKTWASTDWTLLRAMKRYRFWALFGIVFGMGFGYTSLISHLVALVKDIGFTAMFAASLLSIFAVTSMLGRCCGFISDLFGREMTFTLCMAMTLLSLPILLITNDIPPWALYIFIACFGFGSGLSVPSYTATAGDLFQGKQFGTIIGSASIGFGIGAGIGTWLYGYIFDTTGTYTVAIVLTMLALCLTLIAIWVAAPRKVLRVAGRKLT